MGVEATAYLVYGVDVGSSYLLPEGEESLRTWTRKSQISRFVRTVPYSREGETILAVQGTVRKADCRLRLSVISRWME